MQHGLLNLIRQGRQVQGQPIEHIPLGWVSCKVAYQPTLGRVRPELFQPCLIVLHRPVPRFWFRVSAREQAEVKLKHTQKGHS
jgi:hypothetical protein